MRILSLVLGILSVSLFLVPSAALAQSRPSSPALNASAKVGKTEIALKWGAPSVRGRAIWGELVPYDAIWRTGANAATTFTASKEVTIDGKALPAGSYAIFTIPGKSSWTLIFNKNAAQWGAYDYKESEDVLRVTVTPKMEEELTEQLTFVPDEKGMVTFKWEKLSFQFQVAEAK